MISWIGTIPSQDATSVAQSQVLDYEWDVDALQRAGIQDIAGGIDADFKVLAARVADWAELTRVSASEMRVVVRTPTPETLALVRDAIADSGCLELALVAQPSEVLRSEVQKVRLLVAKGRSEGLKPSKIAENVRDSGNLHSWRCHRYARGLGTPEATQGLGAMAPVEHACVPLASGEASKRAEDDGVRLEVIALESPEKWITPWSMQNEGWQVVGGPDALHVMFLVKDPERDRVRQWSSNAVGKPMALLWNGEVRSLMVLADPFNGSGHLFSSAFSQQECRRMQRILRCGPLLLQPPRLKEPASPKR